MATKKTTHGLSFTAAYDGLSHVLKTKVYVESATAPGEKIEADAIWDTGASSSLIRPEIADKLNLKPVSKTMMATPSDKNVPSNVYLVHFYLPNNAKIINVKSLEGTPNSCDVLIGMDIISLGDFAVTNLNKRTMFSFRIPSMVEIDFVKQSYLDPVRNEIPKTGRNDPCPCKSGKKYKQCCLNK